jgi:ATP-dependent DNA ligase
MAATWTYRLPGIVDATLRLPAASATIDGEAVVCDDRGVTDFDPVRAAIARRAGAGRLPPAVKRIAEIVVRT